MNVKVVLEDIFSDFKNCHEKCRLCFIPVTKRCSRIKITDEIQNKIQSVLQVHLSMDGTGSKFICSKCESSISNFHLFKCKIKEKQKFFEKFSNKKVRNIKDEVLFTEDVIKTEDELNVPTEKNLVSPFYDLKEEISAPKYKSSIDVTLLFKENFIKIEDELNGPTETNLVSPFYDSKEEISEQNYEGSIDVTLLFEENFIKTEDELNLPAETELNSPFDEIKEEISEDVQENPNDVNESQNVESNEFFLRKDQSKPTFISSNVSGKVLKSGRQRQQDQNRRYISRTVYCDICGKTCRDSHSIALHMNTHKIYRTKDFHCEICGGSYFDENGLRKHTLNVHKKSKHHTCSLCRRTFRTKESLKTHISNPCRLPCEVCGKMIRKNSLKAHLNRVHLKSRPYRCDICGKKCCSTHLSHLVTTHSGLEHRTKDYQCDICNKVFFDKDGIKMHMTQCHGNTKFPCDLCGKTFKCASFLKQHSIRCPMKVNNSSKIDCETCGKVCIGPNSYLNHMINVHKIAPDKEQLLKTDACDVCNKRFFTKHSLRDHQRTHRKRNLNCDFPGCQKKFITKAGIRRHIFTIHKNIREKCPVRNGCTYSAGRKDYMTNHLRNHKELSHEELQSYFNTIQTMNLI
ncbi:CLUMA_CG000549, isoform A [Clunio marinus]|uniref:CLUMA_CG000549, isoform A n=1 Tax=Clunio marinus TaxID=568069 RepID=A0A1J1HH26_9DIPT|nr:CLUMA_CG000549, isoform A [Clunio marinus]